MRHCYENAMRRKLHLPPPFCTIDRFVCRGSKEPGPKKERAMKVRAALILALCFVAAPLMAQTPAAPPQKPAAQHPPSQLESVVPAVPEKVDPAKDTAIRHLMDITEESKLADNVSGAMSMQVHTLVGRAMPAERLEKFMVDFDQKFRSSVPSSKVIDGVVPIYAKNFTMEEIQGLIKFYESPLGQHVVKSMGQVSHDSQELAVNMEKEAALKTLRAMSTDYPEIAKMLPPEPGTAPASAPAVKPAPAPAPAATDVPTLKPTTPQQ
jgi:uncharacterized protein